MDGGEEEGGEEEGGGRGRGRRGRRGAKTLKKFFFFSH